MRLAASWAGELCVSPHTAAQGAHTATPLSRTHAHTRHGVRVARAALGPTVPPTQAAGPGVLWCFAGRRGTYRVAAGPGWRVWLCACLARVGVGCAQCRSPGSPRPAAAQITSAHSAVPRALPVARVASEVRGSFGFSLSDFTRGFSRFPHSASTTLYPLIPHSRFSNTNTSTLHWNWSAGSTLLRTPAIITSASRPLVAGVRMGMPPSAAAARR